MPSPSTIRFYVPHGYYHIYNRGVEKRNIFLDTSDYKIFSYYLFIYLFSPDLVKIVYPDLKIALRNGNFYGRISLLSYALMRNHFHFLLYQTDTEYITAFMRRVTNAYTRYFNTKYERVGSLFQGVFKGIQADTDNYLLQVSKYIHKNPFILQKRQLYVYPWSSYPNYLRLQNSSFVQTDTILSFFSKTNQSLSYNSFVE